MSQALDSNDELRDLYRELILDHAKRPRHFGPLEGATHTAQGINPLCGDKLNMYFTLDGEGKIADARFEGSGCAISVASASLLMETVIGLSVARALDYFAAMVGRLTEDGAADAEPDIDLGKLRALEGVRDYPSRVKCATLAWHALNSALRDQREPVSTE